MSKTGFCEGGHKKRYPLTRGSVNNESFHCTPTIMLICTHCYWFDLLLLFTCVSSNNLVFT